LHPTTWLLDFERVRACVRVQRFEKTVFVKAPRALKYGDVVKVIDAIKGAGANPVGLQVDDLP
jgi:biopolymer transport protein ExbD